MSTAGPPAARRCPRRTIAPGAPRPSAVLSSFFGAALALLAAGGAAGVANALTGDARLHWLALHLVFLGGVSQLVLGAGQFFTCAFLATTPPPRTLVRAQLAAWNGGTVLVAVGVTTQTTALTDAGGALIAAGLVLFAGALRAMQRRSLQQARWAVRWYQASAAGLGAGALVGVAMARGVAWPHGSLLGAHLALNLAGWMGTAIIGTLHTFFPSLTQTRLRFGRLQGATFGLWTAGVAALALGAAWGDAQAVAAGWLALAAAAGLLGASLLACLRAAPVALTLPARLVALGQAFLPAGVLVALVATASGGASAPFLGPSRGALAVLLLAGWIGLTVSGSLLHLLAVLARVRHFAVAMPPARPARDRLVVVAAGAGVGALALARAPGLEALGAPAAALTTAVAAVLALRIAVLARRALAPRGARRPAGARARPVLE
jgi:nitrite reductase (NO-forming)